MPTFESAVRFAALRPDAAIDARAKIRGRRSFIMGAAALAAASRGALALGAGPTHIAAASDLRFALDEVALHFGEVNSGELRIAYGSSGNFFRQILQGAPFEMFLSADEAFVEQLAARGLTADGGALYALGRLALFAASGSSIQPDAEMRDLRAAAADGRLHRLAIANPDHAPYGRAAVEALRAAGLWDGVAARLALGENVSQAAQFAATGAAQCGLIAYSLARSPGLAARGRHALIASHLYRPLRQRMALLKGAGATARAFHEFVSSPRAREILEGHGFSVPPQV